MKRGMFLTPLLVREGFLGLRPLLFQQAVLCLQLGQPRLELLEPAGTPCILSAARWLWPASA